MLLFTSESFQQSVLRESLDTINRSCSNIRSRTARRGNPRMFLCIRVTDCLTQTKKQKRLYLISNCATSIEQLPHRTELQEKLVELKKKVSTEVNTRTTELYREQGNTDRSMLMVIDDMISVQSLLKIQCKKESLAARVELCWQEVSKETQKS